MNTAKNGLSYLVRMAYLILLDEQNDLRYLVLFPGGGGD